MKRFSFPLEIVRRWRAEQASVEELKLQQIRAAKDRLGALKIAIRAELAKTEKGLLAQAELVSQELETLDSYRIYVQTRVRGLENEERQAETNIVAQRDRVMEARRQFELLDRLRIKTYTEWTAATNKEQEDMVAELYLAKTAAQARRRASYESRLAPGPPNSGDPN